MSQPSVVAGPEDLFPAGSEMATRMRAFDWNTTPLGPVHAWPQSLRTAVRIVLTSRFAMWMGWGPDLTFFYNDAYARMTLGKKHPWALGRTAREVWAEIWRDIGPRIERVIETGTATWDEGLLLFLERSGYVEETYHTFSYSPLTDDATTVAGMLCVVTEETDRVIGARRLASLRELGASLASVTAEADVIHRNAMRLLKLVNTLLDFSRMEAGRIDARYERTDLSKLTAELASSFRSVIEQAGLALELDSRPTTGTVYVDRDMWEKIVLNLVSNAFKHTFDGTVTVALRERDGAAELVVRDTGIGISPDQIPRLFERFYRVPNVRSRTHEGTGIGLALVQELVRLHGGAITVDSVQGTGTSFTVRIPLGSAHLPADRVSSGDGGTIRVPTPASGVLAFTAEAQRWLPDDSDASIAGVRSDDGRARALDHARVLVVDDNADMRDYAARLLGAQGWIVDTAADGAAALAAAQRDPPDLVLSDVMMPRLDGFGLLRALRADPRTSATPIILLSARAGEETRVEGLDTGADDYLVKPFSAQELVARVRSHLSLARVRTAASDAADRAREDAEAAREEAERANRAKSDFLAAMSHELRTPLNAIAGYVPLLEMGVHGPMSDSQREVLRRVQRSEHHLLSLINDVLNFVKIEAGRVEYDMRPVDLGAVVAAAAPIVEQQLQAKRIAFEQRVDSGTTVWADEDKLRQVLLNLLTNAVKFTESGGRVTVDVAPTTGDADTVLLRVTDTGVGIPAEKQEAIFDPFIQVHRHFTRSTEGTGLGLSISRDLARGMGAELGVESVVGKGSVFTLALPRRADGTGDSAGRLLLARRLARQ